MVLQTLFALYSFLPAGVGFGISNEIMPAGTRATHIHEIVILDDERHLYADILTPLKPFLDPNRVPGAVVISTHKTRDLAFLISNKMVEAGITVIIYNHEGEATLRARVFDARNALDSVRRRRDVRPEEVGLVVFDEAAIVVPDLVSDTILNFVLISNSLYSLNNLRKMVEKANPATLIVTNAPEKKKVAGIPYTSSVTPGAERPRMSVVPPSVRDQLASDEDLMRKYNSLMPPNVTVWPVSRDELDDVGNSNSEMVGRVMDWLREQVHLRPPGGNTLDGW